MPAETPMAVAPERLLVRAWRFGRALIVGAGATAADFGVLTVCIRLLHVAPAHARLPALLTGACVQFFGNRAFTFRARHGPLARQARLFALYETTALALNFALYQVLLRALPIVPPELVSFLGTFLVFVGFSYPLRRHVIFRVAARPTTDSPAPGAAAAAAPRRHDPPGS